MRLVLTSAIAVLLAGCGAADSGDAPTTGWTTFHDQRNGLSVRFPSTWHRAAEPLTPDLVDPGELLSVGTYPLRANVRGPLRANAPGRGCAHMPSRAMSDAGAQDVLLSIQERSGPARTGFAPREQPFALGPADDSEATGCAGGPRPWRSHWTAFSDAGRPFYVLVLIGDDAPPGRLRELREVLDSLDFDRSTRFTAGRGIQGRLSPGWTFIRRRLAAAVSDENQIAAATFPVPPGPPDANCTPRAALDRLGPDDALVYGFVYDDQVDLDDFPPRPAHFSLDPQSLQPYECMGASYVVRWREHGRAVQVHVYLGEQAGAERRDEALEFLDDLVIEE